MAKKKTQKYISVQDIAKNSTSVIVDASLDRLSVQELKHKAARFDFMRYGEASAQTVQVNKTPIRVPTSVKVKNEWKAVWRQVKTKWRSGNSSYKELAEFAGMGESTIADIVRAGDANLLD